MIHVLYIKANRNKIRHIVLKLGNQWKVSLNLQVLSIYVIMFHCNTEILVPTQQQFVNHFSTTSITRPYKLQLGATVQLQWDGPQQHHPFCQGPQAGCKEVQSWFDWLLFWQRKEASGTFNIVVYDSITCRSGTIWYMHQMIKMWESQESITSEATYSVFRCWTAWWAFHWNPLNLVRWECLQQAPGVIAVSC